MSSKEIKERLNKAENYIEKGNYRAAREEITAIIYQELTEDEKRKYDKLIQPLKYDNIYFAVTIGLITIIISYFYLVK